ncbi:MAG: response regulator transcription factor [Thermoanaerobaculia bacterium]
MKRILLYGLSGGVLIALLKMVEYAHLVRTYPTELYGGLIAVIFAALGITLGLRLTRPAPPPAPVPLPTPDPAAIRALGLTPREHEILLLIAEGLSNREIGERLFVSENTVKTHSSRLFDKMNVRRRVQAVRKARELRLIG